MKMSNEIGNTILNSLSRGSMDVGNMAKVLAEADVATSRGQIQKKADKFSQEVSALDYLQQNLKAFSTYTEDLASGGLFKQRNVSSSNDSVVSVVAEKGANAGSFSIESLQLARAHTMLSGEFTSKNAPIAEGSIFVNGVEIEIDSSSNTLEGLQKKINASDTGVTASIINNGGSYQLMLSANSTGEASQFAVLDSNGDPVAGLGFQTVAGAEGQDAIMKLNGVEIRNSTNSFDKVVDGLTFNLKTVSNVAQTVSVANDTEAVEEAIRDLVFVYNQLDDILKELGSYESLTPEEQEDEEKKFHGALAGNSILRDLRSEIRESLMGNVKMASGAYTSMAEIGIELDRFGKLNINEDVFTNALATNLDSVELLLSKGGSSNDSAIKILGGGSNTKEGSYEIEITQVAAQAKQEFDPAVLDANGKISIGTNASFEISVDGSSKITVAIAEDDYTQEDLAKTIANAINSRSEVQAANAFVNAHFDQNGKLVLTSEKFGINSNLEISNATGLANAGIADGDHAKVTGQNADGFIIDSAGKKLNISMYADENDGRKFKISSTAVNLGAGGMPDGPAAVRDLEFEVLGMPSGAGGKASFDFTEGFASKLHSLVDKTLDESQDNAGSIGYRIKDLLEQMESLEEKKERIDKRYEMLELKYRMQFSLMQSILGQMQETQDFLTMTYAPKQN